MRKLMMAVMAVAGLGLTVGCQNRSNEVQEKRQELSEAQRDAAKTNAETQRDLQQDTAEARNDAVEKQRDAQEEVAEKERDHAPEQGGEDELPRDRVVVRAGFHRLLAFGAHEVPSINRTGLIALPECASANARSISAKG